MIGWNFIQSGGKRLREESKSFEVCVTPTDMIRLVYRDGRVRACVNACVPPCSVAPFLGFGCALSLSLEKKRKEKKEEKKKR